MIRRKKKIAQWIWTVGAQSCCESLERFVNGSEMKDFGKRLGARDLNAHFQ